MRIGPRDRVHATAEFVVPRSMPTSRFPGGSVCVRVTDVQLELPALAAIARNTPELDRADFGHLALEGHRDSGAVLAVDLQRHVQGAQFFEIVAPILDQRSRRVVLTDCGAEE